MKKIKHMLIGFVLGTALCIGLPVFAEALNIVLNPFPVLINGVETEVEGYNINGSTFLKLVDFKKAGLTVKFNETDRQIEITTAAESSTVALNTPQNNNIGGTKTMIEYDAVTGLPVGAEYVENEKDGKTYKTVQYNGKTYISSNDLKKVFGAVDGFIDPKAGTIEYSKEVQKVVVDISPTADIFFANHYTYYELSNISGLMD